VSNRRQFITLLSGAAATWPLAARAQQPERMPRIAIWIGGAERDPQSQQRANAFRETLRQLGWIDGRNIRVQYRWGIDTAEQIQTDAAESWRSSQM
jgi:putative ABC transport system substrate-binding protein